MVEGSDMNLLQSVAGTFNIKFAVLFPSITGRLFRDMLGSR
jgi:hypothetical protein